MTISRIWLSGGISGFTQIIKIGTIAIFLLLWFKNKTQSGFLVASMGLVSNTLVIFLNGGMPVFLNLNSNLILPVGYLIANDQTILAILSDWIPGLFWEEYVSPSDYLFVSAFYVFWLQNRKKIEKVYWPPLMAGIYLFKIPASCGVFLWEVVFYQIIQLRHKIAGFSS